MFEEATRKQFRFNSVKGLLTVEDLWAMKLTSRDNFDLNTVAQEIYKKINDATEKSFVSEVRADTTNETKLDIVKFIIEYKLAKQAAAETRKVNISRRAAIDDAIEAKRLNELADMSVADLEKLKETL